MKKTITTILFSIFCFTMTFAQDIKNDAKVKETKMEAFASKTGTIIKFVDYKLSNLKLTSGRIAETRIRKLTIIGETHYFYQITKSGEYGDKTASIEYSDLLEIIKALTTLKSEVEKDLIDNPNYLENKFVTEDGFQLGYYISDGKSKWYMKLEKYGTDNTIFINDVITIENALVEAKNIIEEIKK